MTQVLQIQNDSDGVLRKLYKAWRGVGEIREKGHIDNLLDAVHEAIVLDRSPELKLWTVLGIADRGLTQNPLGGFRGIQNGEQILMHELLRFIAETRTNGNSQIDYLLGDGNSTLYVQSESNGKVIYAFIGYILSPDEHMATEAERLGINIRSASDVTKEDIDEAIKGYDGSKFLECLADIDELISGNRLGAYVDDSKPTNFQKLNNQKFAELQYDISVFFNEIHSHWNPYEHMRFSLGDNPNHPNMTISVEAYRQGGVRGNKLSFECNSKNTEVARRFSELQAPGGLLEDRVLVFDTGPIE